MTPKEYIQLQQNIASRFQAITAAAGSPVPNISSLLTQYNSIMQSVASVSAIYAHLPAMAKSLTAVQQSAVLHCANIDYQGLSAALASFAKVQQHILDTAVIADSASNQAVLLDSLAGTLTQIDPYLPPEEKEQCEAVILPKLQQKNRARLTLSDALSILSLLLTILFGIISTLPDEQTERIIAQNEIIIGQQAELIQLEKEDEDLLYTLDCLTESINLLNEEVELLREKLEGAGEPSDGSGQASSEDAQQEDIDAQD